MVRDDLAEIPHEDLGHANLTLDGSVPLQGTQKPRWPLTAW